MGEREGEPLTCPTIVHIARVRVDVLRIYAAIAREASRRDLGRIGSRWLRRCRLKCRLMADDGPGCDYQGDLHMRLR